MTWLRDAFAHHWPHYTVAGDAAPARAWSVGTVLGNQTLVQARPIVRDAQADFLDDFLRTASPCTVSLFAATDPDGTQGCPRVEVARFQRWIGASDLAPARPDDPELGEILTSIRSELPAFLARAATRINAPTTLFFGFLGALHAVGGLRATYVEPDRIREALDRLQERLGEYGSDLFVYDGRTLGVLQQRAPLFAVEPAPPADQSRYGGRRTMLLLSTPDGPPPTPFPGSERIPGGRFTTNAADPWKLERD